jgi:hypothetical protein
MLEAADTMEDVGMVGGVLNHVPPLHDPLGLGSIHWAGVMILVSITVSCQKWPSAPSALAPSREKLALQGVFCKWLWRAEN